MPIARLLPPARPSADDLRRRRLVIGLGAMKSGSTWLADYLSTHPEVFISPIKEMNIFNRRHPNPFQDDGPAFRLWRMEEIALDPRFPRSARLRERLRALAEIGRIGSDQEYLDYFARRMRGEALFGEISPSYAALPPEALRQMARLTDDVRFLFLMRDPAARMVSNLLHLRRRVRADAPVAALLEDIRPGTPLWARADYGRTLDALQAAGVAAQSLLLIYEDLFTEPAIRRLCDGLGIGFHRPDFTHRVNVAQGPPLTPTERAEVRRRLDPIYQDLATRLGPDRPPAWAWDG